MKTALFAGVIALFTIGLAPITGASAGEWRLDPRKCPDLREDYRDSRVTWSRRDAREDRRDKAVTRCPARAWTYVPSRFEYFRKRPAHPGVVGIYVGPKGYYRRHNGRVIAIRVVTH